MDENRIIAKDKYAVICGRELAPGVYRLKEPLRVEGGVWINPEALERVSDAESEEG